MYVRERQLGRGVELCPCAQSEKQSADRKIADRKERLSNSHVVLSY